MKNAFASALDQESRHTYTENGAQALNSTGHAVLDMFGSIGSLRMADPLRIQRIFADAYNEDPLLAMKCLFYARDIRGGLGERNTFRILLKYAAEHHPEAVTKNMDLIGLYGRYDDLYVLVGTQLEKAMWTYMKARLAADEAAMNEHKPCSLLAKWIKTPDASSSNTRKMGILTAKNMGMSVYVFKRKLRALRKYIDVVERKMTAKEWNLIDYETVPSRAMTLYRNAFTKHDETRYKKFIQKVEKGEATIHAATLYPYDLLEKYIRSANRWRGGLTAEFDPVIEAQWKALPNYVEGNTNAIVIADTSGSMTCNNYRPMSTSVGLAIYFAERNRGAFHNLWMSFSSDSKVQRLRGETLAQKIQSIDTSHWENDTNLEAALMHILNIAKQHNVPQDEMVKSIIIISDMEINMCVSEKWTFYDEMYLRYSRAGYQLPNIVFWNCNSRNDIFHADAKRKGVQLCSGSSPSTFKHLMGCINMTPIDMMLQVLNSERYSLVKIGGNN